MTLCIRDPYYGYIPVYQKNSIFQGKQFSKISIASLKHEMDAVAAPTNSGEFQNGKLTLHSNDTGKWF